MTRWGNVASDRNMLCGECPLLERVCRPENSRSEILFSFRRDLHFPWVIHDGKSTMFALHKRDPSRGRGTVQVGSNGQTAAW